MDKKEHKMKVALIFPPFGPPHLANLGIAQLAAGLKARGFYTRTFYWSYQFVQSIPVSGGEQQRHIYSLMTSRKFQPWNDWIFTRSIFPNKMLARDAEVWERLQQLDQTFASGSMSPPPSRIILHLGNQVENLVREMADRLKSYDLIGMTSTFYQNGASLALAKHLKNRWPEKIVGLGGANCDGEMGLALAENFPFLDFVFSGEADLSFPEFADRLENDLDVHDIPGLVFRDAQKGLIQGPPPAPVMDLDSLPIPDFTDYIKERKHYGLYDPEHLMLPLESSRGCWWGAKHQCEFCGLNANGVQYRQKSEERFRREIHEITERYGARYLFMADNIMPTTYYKGFVEWAKTREVDVKYFYEIKAIADRSKIVKLADAGITMVQPGIESFSTKVLKLMNKGIRGIQNVAFLKYASEYGILPAYNILSGFPDEDPFEYEKMAEEVPKFTHFYPPNGVVCIEFHRFSPYHRSPDRFHIRLRPHQDYAFIYPFEKKEIARLSYVFEVQGRGPKDLSYLKKLESIVNTWINIYHTNRCFLTWTTDGRDILIRDRRNAFEHADYRLRDYAVHVFHVLDSPVSLQAIVEKAALAESEDKSLEPPAGIGPKEVDWLTLPAREQAVTFDRARFEADPEECLQVLVDAGVVYREDGQLLALPTHVGARDTTRGWAHVGI